MIPPARPTETPEQIVARGGRPIDFSVNFPAGVAPSGSASVSSGPGGSMFFGGEEVPFTPSDLREYYNKLTDLRMMRAPDGSPLHSNEEAQLIAADWVFQQKAGTLLGR